MRRGAVLLLALAVIAVPSSACLADPLADGVAAYDRGDYATALRILQPLADQGVPYAQYQLGAMYEDGNGVAQSDAESARLYRLAAETGLPVAQANLAVCYEQGRGVPRDLTQALLWYTLAAARETQSRRRDLVVRERDRLARRLTPAQIQQVQALLADWRPREAREE
jgi:hypothetical protein